jgi:hypothetical protein
MVEAAAALITTATTITKQQGLMPPQKIQALISRSDEGNVSKCIQRSALEAGEGSRKKKSACLHVVNYSEPCDVLQVFLLSACRPPQAKLSVFALAQF